MPEKETTPAESTPLEPAYTRGPFAGLTANVLRLGLVSLFADISSEMLYPLIPIFLRVTLHAPYAVIGLIEGAAEATASLLKTVTGRLSDLSGRRIPYVVSGYTLSAVAKPLIALAILLGWPLVLIARILDRVGKGLRSSPRDALLADSIAAEVRGKAFGWHRAMDSTGAVIGPLLALLLVMLFFRDNLVPVFLLAFIPGIIGAACVLLVHERRNVIPRASIPSIKFHNLPPAFRAYLIAWGIFALANSSDVFLILRAQQLGMSTTLVVLLYTLYNLVYAAASPTLGHLSDKLGRRKVLIGGLLIFSLVYLGFALTTHSWQLWFLFMVYGLYIAATDGVGKAWAVDLVPSSIRASGVGLISTVSGIAGLLASIIAGLLWTECGNHFGDQIGAFAAFGYGALGAIIAVILLLRIPESVKAEG